MTSMIAINLNYFLLNSSATSRQHLPACHVRVLAFTRLHARLKHPAEHREKQREVNAPGPRPCHPATCPRHSTHTPACLDAVHLSEVKGAGRLPLPSCVMCVTAATEFHCMRIDSGLPVRAHSMDDTLTLVNLSRAWRVPGSRFCDVGLWRPRGWRSGHRKRLLELDIRAVC